MLAILSAVVCATAAAPAQPPASVISRAAARPTPCEDGTGGELTYGELSLGALQRVLADPAVFELIGEGRPTGSAASTLFVDVGSPYELQPATEP